MVSAEEKNYGWTIERYVNGEKSWDNFSTGDSVELSVKINNFPANDLTYEWYHGRVGIDVDKVGNPISVQEKGNTSSISIIKNAESYEPYTCVVQMDDEEQYLYFDIFQKREDTGGSFHLDPYINDEYGDDDAWIYATPGKDYKLSVNVTSENQDEQYKYTWYNDLTGKQVCDENGQPYIEQEIVVAKSNNGDNDRYRVVVENSKGVKKERSFDLYYKKENTLDALISINDKSDYDSNHISDTIYEGEAVQLKVDVICSPSSDVSYEWRNNGTIIDGADQNVYDLKFSGNSDSYSCTVKSGNETQVYTFWMVKADAFAASGYAYVNDEKINDTDFGAKEGDVVKLCIDTDYNDVKYEWYAGYGEEDEENPLLSSDSFYTFEKTSNKSQETFVCNISNGTDKKTITFYVSLEKNYTTEFLPSQVTGSLYINGNKQRKNSSVYELDSFDDLDDMRLEVKATSPNEIASYKWYQLYGEGGQYYLAKGKAFYLTKDIMEHAFPKTYVKIACRVKEKNGSVKSYFVNFRLKNYTDEAQCYTNGELTNETLIPEGNTVTLKILPEDAKQSYVYEWYDFDGHKFGCDGSELTIRKNGEFEGYYCKLKCGSDTTKYRFFLYSDKQYMIQRWINDERVQDRSWDNSYYYSLTERIEENKESKLEVKVFPDNGDVLYQWYKNGEKLNETNSCIKAVIYDDDEFKCIVKSDDLSKIIRFHFYTYTACDHKEVVTDEAVSPTCEADGLSEGSHCGKCGIDLVEQKPLKATGHKWDNGVITKAPTVSEFGIKLFTCSACHKTYETQIPKATGTTDANNVSVSDNNKNNLNAANGNTVLNNNSMYMITGANTVEYKESPKKTTSVSVPGSVTIKGVKYQVTSIAPKAFKNNKKLKKIIIPASVKSIGKEAYYGCKNLQSIIIKTKLLTTKSVGKNAFRKAGSKNYKKLVVKVPKSKKKSYTKLLRKKGLSSAAKIK